MMRFGTRMKIERKKSPRFYVHIDRSTLDLLASGVATLTFDNGSYTIKVEDDLEALRRDNDAIVRDAWKAYSRFQDEREAA